jgi:glycosyltransferase involved in cell wall biosynthesis
MVKRFLQEEMVGRGVVLYDFLYCRGGAEEVTIELARGIPGTDVCVAFRNRESFDDSILSGIRCLEVGAMPAFDTRVRRVVSGIRAFTSNLKILQTYDWAIFSGSTAPLAVKNRLRSTNIYYCHTLPRFAYDLSDYYLANLPAWQRPAFRLFAGYYRHRFESALNEMSILIANSRNVRNRVRRFLGRDAEVIYPPIKVEGFRWIGQDNYYLSTARLEPYKRVDVVVKAFLRMPEKHLVVASGGSDEPRLRRLAEGASNISFVGWQDANQLRNLVGRAIATLYVPMDEDFGMSPVESMAAGKPVIGVAEGGLLETIVPGVTGFLIESPPNSEAICDTVQVLTPEHALSMRSACEEQAKRFSASAFLGHFKSVIAQTSSECGAAARLS